MLSRLIRYIRGYLRIRVQGIYAERFLNALRPQKHLPLGHPARIRRLRNEYFYPGISKIKTNHQEDRNKSGYR